MAYQIHNDTIDFTWELEAMNKFLEVFKGLDAELKTLTGEIERLTYEKFNKYQSALNNNSELSLKQRRQYKDFCFKFKSLMNNRNVLLRKLGYISKNEVIIDLEK